MLLTGAQQTFALPGCSDASLVANAGGIGFYRVKYDEPLARSLAQRFVRLAPADQATLLSDTFALAQAGELPMTSWFALVNQIPKVTGPARTTLFELAGSGFRFLDDAMAGQIGRGDDDHACSSWRWAMGPATAPAALARRDAHVSHGQRSRSMVNV